ncbi:MAG: hypothetical protein H5T62_10775 [Anaerolineae bacterium]|nr:hypothetical protein [Anaerolineae bacterium]
MSDRPWRIIDTFADFLTYWSTAQTESLPRQIELWRTSYMSKYPELLSKQVQDYENQDLDWRKVAEEHIFPRLAERLPLMRQARQHLLHLCGPIYARAAQVLGLDFEVIFVIYVGLGCGAGWATRYNQHPACLLGLENIAACGWHGEHKLRGLLAHEIGHLTHMAWRNAWESFEEAERDPCFRLYAEGFAQRCEHVMLGDETWHPIQREDWLPWCRENEGWLAREYLHRVESDQPVTEFFGSWHELQGQKQTGYYLGHQLIRWLEHDHSLRAIATLPLEEIRRRTVQFLKRRSLNSG